MSDRSNPAEGSKIERLTAIKSAFILEARSLIAQGRPSFAIPLFRRAAELECELAEWFASRDDKRNQLVSLRSAGYCFVHARQFRTAGQTFEKLKALAGDVPDSEELVDEADRLLAECSDKADVAIPVEPPALQNLVDLLVSKRLITENDWADALGAR